MFFSFPMRFGVALILLSSLIVSSNAADEDVEKFFQIGDSVTFQCQRQNVGDEDSLMKWAIGTKTIFEDDAVVAGVPNAARYSVHFTATDFDLTISSLTEADVGKKIICRLDDGDTTVSLKTYKLKLQPATTAAPTVKPGDDTGDAGGVDGGADEGNDGDSDGDGGVEPAVTEADKSDDSEETNSIDDNTGLSAEVDDNVAKEDLNDNPDAGGGASSLAFSSLLAAILTTLHALTL